MVVWMAGIDHTRAGVDVRSVFSFTKMRVEQACQWWKEKPGISGIVILSTCNRMELWLSGEEDAVSSPAGQLCRYLGVDENTYLPYFTERRDREAVEHLFRLAAGLESMILGEDQILTQVGDALALSRAVCAADHTLEVLFRQAITAGKRVKTESVLSTADQSVIHTALDMLASERGLSVAGRRCMVIGNGMMGKLAAQTLLSRGADVTVTVRKYHNGVVDVPEGCRRISYDQRYQVLPECDVIVSATSSPNYTLLRPELEKLTVDREIFLLDLAVPRDIDPEAGELPWVSLYDIDSFHIDRQSEALRHSLEKANAILAEEEEKFFAWQDGRDIVPRIQHMRSAAGADTAARLTPVLRRSSLPEETRRTLYREVEGAAGRMMNHLLFALRERLPEESFQSCLEAMEDVFSETANKI